MKTIDDCGIRNLVLAALLGMGMGLAAQASAGSASYLIDLNSRKVIYLGNNAAAINDSGQVVGTVGNRAFITGASGVGKTYLETLGGHSSQGAAINDVGRVAGGAFDASANPHAFITGPNGMGITTLDMTALNSPDYDYSSARGINASGQVVGAAGSAFITGPNGMGVRALDSGGHLSFPYGINDSGQVAGWTEDAVLNHAFITGPDGTGMRAVGSLGGDVSWGYAINNAGQVVGAALTGDGKGHAFITGPDGTDMRDLNALNGFDSDDTTAYAINDAGQVVGDFRIDGGSRHAFVTGPDGAGMTDLNSLVDLPNGIILNEASGINNAGQVIATAVMVVPEPGSYALLLAGLALLGVVTWRNKDVCTL